MLWSVLILGSGGFGAAFAFWLVRKALRALRDGGSALSDVMAPRSSEDEVAAQSEGRMPPSPASRIAVFERPDDVRLAYEQGKAERREARRQRRISRRAQRGQAQSPRDLGLI